MGVLIRTLLVWLLVLAIPAQGAAAASMAMCGPGHHAAGVADAGLGANVSEHAHHADAMPDREADAGMLAGADSVSAIEKASHAAKQKCSVCASCCSAGAILTTVPSFAAPDAAPTVFITVVPSVDAFAADGPERPPRNVLA